MMQLPALSPEERTWLLSVPSGAQLPAFAARLRQRLVASLGAPARISANAGNVAQAPPAGDEPVIVIDSDLASAWLDLRMGGRGNGTARSMKDSSLIDPFRALIRRALAESVVNAGPADWPQFMQLYMQLGGGMGEAEVFWNSAHAMDWARKILGERT